MSKYVDLIIFDLDGTLIDSKQDIVNSINFMLKKLGIKQRIDSDIASYIGTGVLDLIKKSLTHEHEGLSDKALAIFEEHYKDHSTDNSMLYPHVKQVLEYFKNKKMAIISNKKKYMVTSNMKTFKIYDFFSDIIGGDDATCAKPSPCPIDKILEKHNIDKKKAIIVGDMHIDILAGKQAGISTCGATYGIGKKDDVVRAQPDYLIDNISELMEIIE